MRCCALLPKNQFVLCVFLRCSFLRGAENIGGGDFYLTHHLLLQVRANLLFACAFTKHYRCRSVFCSAHFLID
jgi:hypothetical protein